MKSSKIKKKLLVSILCASMMFQNMSIGAFASEDAGITEVQTEEVGIEEASQNEESIENKESEEAEATVISETPETEITSETDSQSETETADLGDLIEETATVAETIEESEEAPESNTDGMMETEAAEDEITEDVMTEEIMLFDGEGQPDYNKLSLLVEDTYCYYGDKLYVFAKLEGCEIPGTGVNVKFFIDNDEKTANLQGDYYFLTLNKSDVVAGTHTLKAELSTIEAGSNTKTVRFSQIKSFKSNDTSVFLEKNKYYMGASDDSLEITVFDTTDNHIQFIELVKNGETVASSEGSAPTAIGQKTDPRYSGIGKDLAIKENENILYKSVWSLKNLKNSLDSGTYTIQVTLTDGATMSFSNAVEVSADAVVTKCTIGADYDNTSEYVYLYIQGSGFDPSQVQFSFKNESQTGTSLYATQVDYKAVWSGYVVKFQKGGNWNQAGSKIYVSMTGKSGYQINFTQNEFVADVQTGIYYAEYNPALKAIEVGVTVDLNGQTTKFSIVDATDASSEIRVTSQTLTESLLYLTPVSNLAAGTYYVRLEVSGTKYHKEFNMEQSTSNVNYWDAPTVISKNAERHYFYYYSAESGISSTDLSATISNYGGDVAVSASEWLREDGGSGTCIKVVIPTQKLDAGGHTVTIKKSDSSEIVSYSFEIVDALNDKFVLDTYSLSWKDDNTIQVYIKTPNCAVEDDFNIKLTETSGKEVSGISAVVTNRYADCVYMDITGLSRNKAYKDYYVLLTHKTYGYPVTMSDMNADYYTDQTMGELTSIAFNRGFPVKADNRVIGINIQYMTLPINLRLYATNGTSIISELNISSATEDDYYYFTKAFYDQLSNKDMLYDMTVTDADGWGKTYSRIAIGYKDETVQSDFTAVISKDILYVDDENEKAAEITVSGNTQKPVFESSDETVATVTADADDPNKAIVRVAGDETGTVVITIFADGVEKSFVVTVTKKVDSIILNTSNRKMKVGDSVDVEAFVVPNSAKNDTQVMTFTSSDSSVLYVKRLTDTTAKITAMKSGTAILRVNLKGTACVTSISVTITDEFSLTEKKEKIAEAGTSCYIENVDKTLSYCQLPKGWAWDEGTLSLTASDGAKIQYYSATYTEEGYESFTTRLPVAVTRITGVDIAGKNVINPGKQESYDILYEYIGSDIDSQKFDERLSVNCVRTSEANIAVVKSVDRDNVVIEAKENTDGGLAEFALTLSIDNGTNTGVNMFVREFGITIPVKACVNDITITPVKENGQNFTFLSDDKLMEIDINEIKSAKNKYAVELKAVATINGVAAKNVKLNWKSSDSSVASVAEDKNGKVTLTIKKEGIVEITAAADDAGQCVGALTVKAMDYAPVLETTSVTINKYSTQGSELILQDQNGNTITSVRVLEQDAESENFSVSKPVDGVSKLVIKDKAPALSYAKKTTSNCKLEVRTTKGNYLYALKITTDVTKPTATLKLKSKANLFYTDAEAVYTISSKYAISSVEDVGTGTVRFFGKYNKNTMTVQFQTNGTLDSTTLSLFTTPKSPCLNTVLKVYFAGYSEPQLIQVKVATENKKPSYGMTGLTFCPGISAGTVSVINTKTKEALTLNSSSMTLIMQKPADHTVGAVINRKGGVDISYSATKNVSYTAALTSSQWTQPVNISGKITYVKAPEQMALALGSKQLTLNMGTNVKANGTNSIAVAVNNSDATITSLSCDGTAKQLIDTGYLSYAFDAKEQKLRLGLVDGKRGTVKAGSYKLNLYATINVGSQSVMIKKATLTIKLVEPSAAKVTLSSPKGKINLIDRGNTSIVYTPKISGIDTTIRSVSVTGENADYFTAALNQDKKVEVKAKTGKNMSAKTTYAVTILVKMENGYQISSVVKIKPTNTLPKIVLSPAKCNLYRSNSNQHTVTLSLKNSSIDLKNITSFKLDTGNKAANNFSVINNISKNGTVSFSLAGNRNNIRKGTYTLKCQVTFKDAATDSKPATVNMTVTVK